MRPLFAVLAVALVVSGCGADTGRVDGGEDHPGADFSSTIAVSGDSLTIEYTLRNTGDATLVAFDRGWVADASAPRQEELEATRDDVQVIVSDDTVEFGLRIIHDCHGNPQGERTPDTEPHRTDCGTGDAPVKQRIAATRVEPGKSVSREYRFDLASVWPDYPTDQAQTTIGLSGKRVVFCLGVDRPASPPDDDLYPPGTDETVLCGDPVTVD